MYVRPARRTRDGPCGLRQAGGSNAVGDITIQRARHPRGNAGAVLRCSLNPTHPLAASGLPRLRNLTLTAALDCPGRHAKPEGFRSPPAREQRTRLFEHQSRGFPGHQECSPPLRRPWLHLAHATQSHSSSLPMFTSMDQSFPSIKPQVRSEKRRAISARSWSARGTPIGPYDLLVAVPA
jgi:hypothetical protein